MQKLQSLRVWCSSLQLMLMLMLMLGDSCHRPRTIDTNAGNKELCRGGRRCTNRDSSHSLPTTITTTGGQLLGFGLFASLFVSADGNLRSCRADRCIPDCACELSDRSACARDYGSWGWIPPEGAGRGVWTNLKPEYEIKPDQIKPVGMRGGNRENGIGRGIGKIVNITNETMIGEVYFEIHPDQLSQNTGYNNGMVFTPSSSASLVVEIYGGIEFGLSPCDDGIILGKQLINMTGFNDAVENFEYEIVPLEDYNSIVEQESVECHPRSINGVMASAVFALNDPFYYNEQSASIMNLWYPFRVDVNFGSMEFCVRLEMIDPTFSSKDDDYTDDYFKKKKVTSIVDTKFKVEISAPTEENNFTRFDELVSEVKMYSNQNIGPTPETTVILPPRYNDTESPTMTPSTEIVIPVTTFLCSAPDESDVKGSFDPSRTYRLGQTFRLCVEPSKKFDNPLYENNNRYAAVGFESVSCENNGRNKTLVDEFGVPDEYTTINRDTVGFTIYKGGIVTSRHTISINSVINADLAGVFPDGFEHFECSGRVLLERSSLKKGGASDDADEVESRNDGNEDGGAATDQNNTSARRYRQLFRRVAVEPIRNAARGPGGGYRNLQEEESENENDQPSVSPERNQEGNGLGENSNGESEDGYEEDELPLVGILTQRVEVTTGDTVIDDLDDLFTDSLNTVTKWFSSSPPRVGSVCARRIFGTTTASCNGLATGVFSVVLSLLLLVL